MSRFVCGVPGRAIEQSLPKDEPGAGDLLREVSWTRAGTCISPSIRECGYSGRSDCESLETHPRPGCGGLCTMSCGNAMADCRRLFVCPWRAAGRISGAGSL